MTKFQEYVDYNIMYAKSKIEQEAIISFAFKDNKIAEEVTDLDSTQLELGGYIIDDYSDYLMNPEQYINKLKEEVCVN